MFHKSYTYPFIDSAPLVKSDCLGLSGVYMVLNNLNGDSYIGSAISKTLKHNRLYFRFRNHLFHSEKATNIHLQRAIVKYGLQNFTFHILGFYPANETRQEETKFIKKYKPVYNILKEAQSSIGYTHTQESKDKMSVSYTTARRSLRETGALNKGKSLSSETKLLLSMAAIERNKLVSYKLKQKEGLLRTVETYPKATQV
jgi:group I intron endonuclease